LSYGSRGLAYRRNFVARDIILQNALTQGERTSPTVRPPELARSDPMPIRIGSAEEFAQVRDFLHAVGFDERAVSATLKIGDISQIPTADPDSIDTSSASPALLAVTELLVLGNEIAVGRLRAAFGDATFAAFAALDLIHDARGRQDAVVCPVWIYPVDGLFIASDRRTGLEGDAFDDATEVVFPAHDSGTLQMLRLLPDIGTGDALDLCGGSGIGGLHLARNGKRAATADITVRSAYFAEFNARLNGIEIEILCGDLYAPVSGRQFDVICAHPPWLPSTGDAMVFRDGGVSGEEIVQRVFAGIPHHLRRGGTGIVVALGRDGSDAAYEQRVRGWLGDAGRDCDVILGVDKMISIDDVVGSVRRLHLNDDAEKAQRMAARFREIGTEKFVYGAAFVRRTGNEVAEPPLRLRMSPDATAGDFERIFAWRQHRRLPEFVDWLAAARPRLCPQLEANVRYVVRNAAMAPASAILTAKRPLSATVQPDIWIALMLERLEGKLTVEQTFEAAQQAGQMPADFTLPAFVDVVGRMIERGLLDIDMPTS
jgi:SAM-dependent methyltransferase